MGLDLSIHLLCAQSFVFYCMFVHRKLLETKEREGSVAAGWIQTQLDSICALMGNSAYVAA